MLIAIMFFLSILLSFLIIALIIISIFNGF